jgi:hypothetical protein
MKNLISLAFMLVFFLPGCLKDDMQLDAPSVDFRKGVKVEICHLLGNGNSITLLVNENAVAAHLAHGDFLGPCPEEADFFTFKIRNHNGSIEEPWDTDMIVEENPAGDGFSAETPLSGQKVGYGTHAFDGMQINTIETVNWDKVSGKANVVAYLNMWVTDGNGNYAIISSENDYRGTDFATRQEWKVFEFGPTTDLNWLFSDGGATRVNQYLVHNGMNTTLAELGDNIVLESPTFPQSYIGTGAPRAGYAFNLIFGDTQSNFTGSYHLEHLSVTVAGIEYLAAN